MNTERISQLHEQASERYLNGDYAGALAAWNDVLGLDPGNEEALEGVRMATQFVAPEAAAPPAPAPVTVAPAASDVEHDLDEGLKVLGGSGISAMLEDGTDGATDRPPAPAGVAALTSEEMLDGWDAPQEPAGDTSSFGLEPMQQASAAGAQPSAAGAELKRRVDDLLKQAKAKAEAGERDEALSVLARLAILDEDNAEAAELRAKIEAAGASDLDKVERAIIEGVSALEADKLDDAERYFQEALAIAPDHREAKHYLEKVAQRKAAAEEDLLAGGVGESAPADGAVAAAVPAEPPALKKEPAIKVPRPARPTDVFDPPPASGSPRVSLPSGKILVLGGMGLVLIALGAFMVPKLLGGGGVKALPPAPPPPVKRPVRPATEAPKSAAAPMLKANSPEGAKALADALRTGRERMAAQDFGGAVVAFNQALTIDPANAEAKTGFDDAGERYKASKAESDALNSIRSAFKDGEFTAGMRLAYRLPPTVSKTYVDHIKLVGWYNLAVVALRAGDCRGAMTQLGEALQIDPEDAQANSLKEFAARYADAVKDRAFLDRVEALAFRPMPES